MGVVCVCGVVVVVVAGDLYLMLHCHRKLVSVQTLAGRKNKQGSGRGEPRKPSATMVSNKPSLHSDGQRYRPLFPGEGRGAN